MFKNNNNSNIECALWGIENYSNKGLDLLNRIRKSRTLNLEMKHKEKTSRSDLKNENVKFIN